VIAGKARRVPVNIVQRQEGRVLVEGNLNTGDLIVVEGIQRLRPGVDVTVESRSDSENSTLSNEEATGVRTSTAVSDNGAGG